MKGILTAILTSGVVLVFAQSNQLQNTINYLKSKEYDRAKAAADAAAIHPDTEKKAKLWMYRGKVYQAIYQDKDENVRKLDLDAEEKSVESYMSCLKLDKDEIYKEEVKGLFAAACGSLSNKALFYADNREFDKAIKAYDMLESALPFDFDQSLKRNNITKEKILFNRYKTYVKAANKEKIAESANKLIETKYKDPSIYTDMIKISLIDKDTAKALSYIEKGKLMFEENLDIINQEINIYLAQKKLDQLKDKLNKAIEVAPDNEVLYTILATIYQKNNELDKAESSYLKALELKPDYEIANYNLGVMYFNAGNSWNEKLNNLPPKESSKAKEYETKANEQFKKAVVYLEKSYEASPDKNTKKQLRQLFLRLGETEKADKYK
jgi:hypothetical protein